MSGSSVETDIWKMSSDPYEGLEGYPIRPDIVKERRDDYQHRRYTDISDLNPRELREVISPPILRIPQKEIIIDLYPFKTAVNRFKDWFGSHLHFPKPHLPVRHPV